METTGVRAGGGKGPRLVLERTGLDTVPVPTPPDTSFLR